jgi:hypothetical protein
MLMHKTYLICSLLTAFGISLTLSGCEPSKSPSPPNSKETKTAPQAPGKGSTTGGGTEVPKKPSKGEAEAPK